MGAKMEADRTFIGHVTMCCIRTSFSACIMQTCNILATFYFFGVRNEFDAMHLPFTPYGCMKKLGLFVIEMFIWEIFFDFGHYWGHRMGHYFKWLYDFGHSKHHENISPDAFDGLNITFDDAMLTNWIPHMFPMFPPLAYYTGIDIGTAAYHSLHHRYYTCNYAKRFTLWDRVFGTMRIPPVIKRHDDKKRIEKKLLNTFKKNY